MVPGLRFAGAHRVHRLKEVYGLKGLGPRFPIGNGLSALAETDPKLGTSWWKGSACPGPLAR